MQAATTRNPTGYIQVDRTVATFQKTTETARPTTASASAIPRAQADRSLIRRSRAQASSAPASSSNIRLKVLKYAASRLERAR